MNVLVSVVGRRRIGLRSCDDPLNIDTPDVAEDRQWSEAEERELEEDCGVSSR